MIRRSLLATLAVASLAALTFAAQEAVSFVRTYKEGESDAYSMKLVMESQMGSIDVQMDMTQTVKKVYENGDADIETKTENMVINAMGQEMRPPASPPTSARMNKFGEPVQTAATQGRMNMDFMRFGTSLGGRSIKVGETINIDSKDEKNPKNRVKGTYTLVSVENGVAKLTSSMQVWNEQTGDKPIQVDATSYVFTKDSKLQKMEGKVKGLPATGQMPVDSMSFTMTKK